MNQAKLPEDQRLHVTDACQIIYPGKNHDAWWDLVQLKDQLRDAVDIFEFFHANAVGVWVFDCSSSHEGLASNALNVNNMNVNPGGKQTLLCDTIIPLNNPLPRSGKLDSQPSTNHGVP
jgi:hypothetical protein